MPILAACQTFFAALLRIIPKKSAHVLIEFILRLKIHSLGKIKVEVPGGRCLRGFFEDFVISQKKRCEDRNFDDCLNECILCGEMRLQQKIGNGGCAMQIFRVTSSHMCTFKLNVSFC